MTPPPPPPPDDDPKKPGDPASSEPAATTPPPKRKRRPPPGFDAGWTEEPKIEEPIEAPPPEPSAPVVVPPPHPVAASAPVATFAPGPDPAPWTPPPFPGPQTDPSIPSFEAPQSWSAPMPAAISVPAGDPSTTFAAPVAPGAHADDPLAPIPYASSDLRDAVGAKPRTRRPPPGLEAVADPDADDDVSDRSRSRKLIIVAILSLIVGLGIAALVFLGRANSSWYYVSCEPERVVAEQGRGFPPWGSRPLEGKQWTPIKIPPEAECASLETESFDALTDAYRKILVDRASVLLTASEVTKVDDAAAMLEQALLHARSDSESHRKARPDIQRLLGDVVYWRASAKLRDASSALTDAAKQFDAAAVQRPRHVSDASAWASFVRKLADDLKAGPAGAPPTAFPPVPPDQRTPAPPGVALPVEPDRGSAGSAGSPAPPDAGVSGGGVLL